MHRFFCPSINTLADKIIISDKKQIHHIKDVLRLKANDEIVMFDERGNEYNCVIKKLSSEVTLDIKEKHLFEAQAKGIKITVACAMPKKSKMDDIIDKLTQLGVDRIIPLETERVIIKLDNNKKILRQKHWQKIAQSASQQSQRSKLPIIEPIKNIEEVLSELDTYDLKLIPTLLGERKSLKDILTHSKPKNILALLGPEGDFTPREVDAAKRTGFIPISLGDLVLRVDTACIAVVSFIKLYENC